MNTWPDFETLAEKHNGVWGGCWCMSFHSEGANKSTTYELNHQRKAQRVSEGRAHAALVYVGGIAVGWCQFGPSEELPHIKHAREYTAKLTNLPDWRITCFFVDRDDPESPVFINRGNHPFNSNSLRHLIVRLADKAGVKAAHPHKFRHTFAITYLRSGGDVFTLQALLGHSSLDMVRHYAQIAEMDIERVHRKASPVDNLRF